MCLSVHTITCPYFCLCAVYFCWFILFYFVCTLSSTVALLQLISRGSPMSFEDSNRIIPLFYLFSSLFSHSLISVHDSEFFGHELEGITLFPFFLFGLCFKSVNISGIHSGHILICHFLFYFFCGLFQQLQSILQI